MKETANTNFIRCQIENNMIKASKYQIAQAVEEIYADKKIKVLSVNTINVKQKERRVRGRTGFKSAFKKAIVTLESGDSIDENV